MGSRDSTITTKLIEDNQGLVYSIALKIYRKLPVRYELEDLIGYGMVGLSEAAKAFKPTRAVEFSTFAFHRIQGSIYDGIAEASWMSRAMYRRLTKQNREAEAKTENTCPESDSESESPSESEPAVKSAKSEFIPSIQPLTDLQQEGLEDHSESPNTTATRKETHETLCLLVDRLPLQKGRLITMVYFEGRTLQFAADRLGISKSWASRLHATTLTELAHEMRQAE